MRRITVDPVLDIESGQWLPRPHFYLSDDEIPIRLDRSIQKSTKNQEGTDEGVAGGYGTQAAGISSSLIPGLERDANNPTGFDTTTKNNMQTEGAQAIGGVNSGVTGAAQLAAGRTRNAGGYTGALDEAARIKGRQQAANALGVENESARVGLQKQEAARQQLAGLYGTDTSNQLHAMGLTNDATQNQLAAGRQGWFQNTNQLLATLGGDAEGAGKILNG